MSVDKVSSNLSVPHTTRIFQTENPNGSSIRITRQFQQDEDGKHITKEYADIKNPKGSDLDVLLKQLDNNSFVKNEKQIFKKALEHLDGLDMGVVSNLPQNSTQEKPFKKDENANKTDDIFDKLGNNYKPANDIKPSKDGMKISAEEMNKAIYAMREDIQKKN